MTSHYPVVTSFHLAQVSPVVAVVVPDAITVVFYSTLSYRGSFPSG